MGERWQFRREAPRLSVFAPGFGSEQVGNVVPLYLGAPGDPARLRLARVMIVAVEVVEHGRAALFTIERVDELPQSSGAPG